MAIHIATSTQRKPSGGLDAGWQYRKGEAYMNDDERKLTGFLTRARADRAWRVFQDPNTDDCSVFIGKKLILRRGADFVDKLDDPANIPLLLFELEQELRSMGI
jgi:hypothetical protein